jgi:ubiquinone biosynthesis monooxygenase Coq6
MEVWDGISDARINFNTAELVTGPAQFKGMARLTENLNIQRGLLRLLDNAPGVDLIHQTKVICINRESEGYGAWPIVNLDNGRRLRARLLVSCIQGGGIGYPADLGVGWSRRVQLSCSGICSDTVLWLVL